MLLQQVMQATPHLPVLVCELGDELLRDLICNAAARDEVC